MISEDELAESEYIRSVLFTNILKRKEELEKIEKDIEFLEMLHLREMEKTNK